MQLNSLLLLLWNARSILGKKEEIQKILDDNKPHITCITETWLKNKNTLQLNGYEILRKDRDFGRTGGGVAFIVNKHLNYYQLQLQHYPNGQIECIGVALHTIHSTLNILLCYNPSGYLDKNEIGFYRKQIKGNIIICGDFNAKHHSWNRSGTNPGGDTLYNYINTSHDLHLLTPPFLETRYNSFNNIETTLDLFIGNTDILLKTTEVNSLTTTGTSDHYPTALKLDIHTEKTIIRNRERWIINDEKKYWEKWGNLIKNTKVTNLNTTTEKIKKLTQNINDTAKNVFKFTKGQTKERKVAVWWSEECSKARALKRRAKQKLKRHYSQENLINYNKLKANFKRTIKQTKKESWKKYCLQLNSNSPISQIWEVFNMFAKKRSLDTFPLITPTTNNLTLSPLDKANIFANYYNSIFGETIEVEKEQNISQSIQNNLQQNDQDYNKNFTMKELDVVLKNLPNNKAAGIDNIPYEFITKLDDDNKKLLLKIYNDCWEKSYIPLDWKQAIILPFHKKSKNPALPI